jgi:hypothetical protein
LLVMAPPSQELEPPTNPGRFSRYILDLPRRQACAAGQERQRVFAADRQQYGWLDLDRPRAAADGASVSDLGAAESGRRETAVAEMFGSQVDGTMLIEAGAVDPRLEPKRRDFTKRREGQRVEHPARLEPASGQ